MLKDVSSDLVIDLTAVCIVLGAGVGGDGEALRHRHAGCSHLSQASALAAQSILHGDLVAAESIIAFAEVVQILFAHALFTSHSSRPCRKGSSVSSFTFVSIGDEHCFVNAKLLYQKSHCFPPCKIPNLFDIFYANHLNFTKFSGNIKWEKVREVFLFLTRFLRLLDTTFHP